jgi:hypothetical protein
MLVEIKVILNSIGDVMANVLTASSVDRGFKTRSGQTFNMMK